MAQCHSNYFFQQNLNMEQFEYAGILKQFVSWVEALALSKRVKRQAKSGDERQKKSRILINYLVSWFIWNSSSDVLQLRHPMGGVFARPFHPGGNSVERDATCWSKTAFIFIVVCTNITNGISRNFCCCHSYFYNVSLRPRRFEFAGAHMGGLLH